VYLSARVAGYRFGDKVAEGSKPPSVRPGIRLCVHIVSGLPFVWTCTGEDSPFHPFSTPMPRWVTSPFLVRPRRVTSRSSSVRVRARADESARAERAVWPAHTSSVGRRGLVSVPVPAVSRSGLAPGHLPDGGGTFLVSRTGRSPQDTGAGLPLPSPTTRAIIKTIGLARGGSERPTRSGGRSGRRSTRPRRLT